MFRFLSALFLILALLVLGADLWPVVTGAEGATVRLSALGEWWFWFHPGSLQLLQPAIERHLSPAIWDPGIQTVLGWPLAIILAALALLCWLLRRRAKTERHPLDFNKK